MFNIIPTSFRSKQAGQNNGDDFETILASCPRCMLAIRSFLCKSRYTRGFFSRGTLREQSSSVCTNDFMGVIHSREQNFHPAKRSTALNRLHSWGQDPGANWTDLKTLPRVYHNMEQAPTLCSPLCTSRANWPWSMLLEQTPSSVSALRHFCVTILCVLNETLLWRAVDRLVDRYGSGNLRVNQFCARKTGTKPTINWRPMTAFGIIGFGNTSFNHAVRIQDTLFTFFLRGLGCRPWRLKHL